MSTTADTSLLPWIGKDYSAGFRGRHILVLGESFYCDDCDPCILAPDSECRQMPRKTVDDYLSYRKGEGEYRSWMKTFIVFERAVYGHETTVEECLAFWNAVIFDNYVQTPVPAPRTAPTAAQWEQAVPVFSRLLSEYRPDRVIPWGDRLYNKLPPLDGREGEPVSRDDSARAVWVYPLGDGHCCEVLSHDHPSSGYSWEYWHACLEQFTKR